MDAIAVTPKGTAMVTQMAIGWRTRQQASVVRQNGKQFASTTLRNGMRLKIKI